MRFTGVVTFVAVSILASFASAGPIRTDELDQQKQAFKQWWDDDLVLKLEDLPTEGKVPDYRVPYSGHDYPDKIGGTIDAMVKYDRAFHPGRGLATAYEREDVGDHRGNRRPATGGRRGLFGGMFRGPRTPGWYGHCNGWTAAAIRHAEPQNNVVRNGVTFTPADIKGMLAEIYMYSSTEFLGGVDHSIHPATLHLTMCNWLGRGSHPIGVETAVGEVVINYPIYSYKSTVTKLSDRRADVRMTVTYRVNTPREYEKGPDLNRNLVFHYSLDLNDKGEITGGQYFGDTNQVDMLWAPLKPTQGGTEGNKRGNPHLDVKEVLAIWRESVPEEIRKKWLNIDPTEEDRVLPEGEVAESTTGGAAAASTSTDM